VVAEPRVVPHNKCLVEWTMSVRDPAARKRAYELLSSRPFLNSGFAAATVSTMLRYLEAAHRIRHSRALRGTTDWGDQTAMNLCCHSMPDRFVAVDERWNYCLGNRNPNEFQCLSNRRFIRAQGGPISVVHGTGGSLTPYEHAASGGFANTPGLMGCALVDRSPPSRSL
jgi:hypothetical protein